MKKEIEYEKLSLNIRLKGFTEQYKKHLESLLREFIETLENERDLDLYEYVANKQTKEISYNLIPKK